MRHFTIAAATVAIAALISAAPASAERINGGPIQQNGKCWFGHGGASEAAWGYWGSCAEKASRGGRRGGGGAVQATPGRRT
jgi:opacity protein-like surface antigen